MSNCIYCKNDTVEPSTTTHVVTFDDCVIIIKNVPCEKCSQCGEVYYSRDTAKKLDIMVTEARKLMQEIAVIDYSKAA